MNVSAIQPVLCPPFVKLRNGAALLLVAALLVLPTLCVLHCHGLLHTASSYTALFVCHDSTQTAPVPLPPPTALFPMVLPAALLVCRSNAMLRREPACAMLLLPQTTVAPLERPPRFI